MKTNTIHHQLAALFLLLSLPALAAQKPVAFETASFRFQCDPDTGRYEIRDQQAGQVWRSNPYQARFGEVTLNVAGKPQRADLGQCIAASVENGLDLTFHPLADKPSAWLRIQLRARDGGKALEVAYSAADNLSVQGLRLLDEAFWVADTDPGYLLVPVREGLLVPADSGLAFTQRFGTYEYEGCHMRMLGVVKRGAAALITWEDPYVTAELRSALTNAPSLEGKQILSASILLRQSATAARIRFLGAGDQVTIAKAYREVARQSGWLVPWADKLKDHPERAQLFGAINYKLWSTLTRRMNEDSTKEESVRLSWTFDEAAQVAEHLKNDLKLDKVLFTLGGWIHRGYDCQHPDILPTAPECGGDAAFADCARRVMRLGYLFCLHDNYQDIYRDSPSWNEDLIMKTAEGSLAKGGHWNGGRAYLTCSKKALELARRPQNLPAVKQLSGANAYFIDTTYAAGLCECFDKKHPLTRGDDMKWKQAISDEARRIFGIFGSECGREWAIPHSDFFEGLTGVSGTYYHNKDLPKNLGATVVPLFELVYRDCIAMYGKYGYDPSRAAEYVLHHLSIGRPLNYHNIPAHLYWKTGAPERTAPAAAPASSPGNPALFTRADGGWADNLHRVDRFVKNTYEILSPLNELTSQLQMSRHEFLSPDRKIQRSVFGEGAGALEVIVNAGPKPYACKSKLGGDLTLPPYGFLVELPEFVAFHALNWNGLSYEDAPLFTLRALDHQPLAGSRQVRIFHAFGDPRIRVGTAVQTVAKESLIENSN